MKTKLHIKIAATVLITLFCVGSVKSQNIISSVNVHHNAKKVSTHFEQKDLNSELKIMRANNWMQNKSYLDFNSSVEILKLNILLNEKVIDDRKNIENWMTDFSEFAIEDQNKQKLEALMFNKAYWTICDPDKCELEDWMFDKSFWVVIK